MQVKTFEQRIEQIEQISKQNQHKIQMVVEKMQNMKQTGHMEKMSKGFKTIGDVESELESRVRRIEDKVLLAPEMSSTDESNFQIKMFTAKVDESLRIMEDKLVAMISERFNQHKGPQRQSRQRDSQPQKSHSRSRSHSKSPVQVKTVQKSSKASVEQPKSNFEAIQKAVNTWTTQVEEQINLINDDVQQKVNQADFESIQNDIKVIEQRASNTEKLTARLGEDIYDSIDSNNKKINQFELKFNELQEWVDELSSGKQINITAKDNSDETKKHQYITRADLMDFERKLNRKILDSLEQTNSIMKKIKGKYKNLSKRVKRMQSQTSRKSSVSGVHKKYKSQDRSAFLHQNQSLSDMSDKYKRDLTKNQNRTLDRVVQPITTKAESNNITQSAQKSLDSIRTMEDAKIGSHNQVDTARFSQKDKEANQNIRETQESRDRIEHDLSSSLFDLSDNENSNRKSRSRSSKKLSSRRKSKSKENMNPNTSNKKRSRVQEFESLRRKGKDQIPINLKSRSNSKKRPSLNSTAKKRPPHSTKHKPSPKYHSTFKSKETRIKNISHKKHRNVVPKFERTSTVKKQKDKTASIKLAKLEKMYQELSELDSKS